MVADITPTQVPAPAPIPSRNVMVWGDQRAMDSLRIEFEAKGWRWAMMMLGEKTPALMLMPPPTTAEKEITEFVTEINAGKFGRLNGGYAQLGAPNGQSGSTSTNAQTH